MSDTKANLIARLPETVIIAGLATVAGYLIHEATTSATMNARIDVLEVRVTDLEKLHPRK